MSIITFAPAVRKGAHVIVTAYGESGCGKTYSLIKLGRGLVGPKGKLALLDTETGRGMIYAKLGYDYAELTQPFTPERYIEAIEAAEEAGIDALIIDSGSHEWAGMGGLLEIADAGGGAGLLKWAKPKGRHNKYVQKLLQTRMHLLISLRAKEKLRQLTAKDTLPTGTKVGDIISEGYVPIQDKRFIFETTVQLFLPMTGQHGVPIVEKCPEDLIGAFPGGERISEDTGRKIAEWVAGGEPIDHETLELKQAARNAAGNGTEYLRAYWRMLSKPKRDKLAGEVDNLGSIAATADEEAAERERERAEGHRSFQPLESEPLGVTGNTPEFDSGDPGSNPGGAATRSFAIEPHKPAGKPIDWEHTRADLCAAAYSIASPADLALFRRDNRVTIQALGKADAEAAEQVENALRDKEIAMAEVERDTE